MLRKDGGGTSKTFHSQGISFSAIDAENCRELIGLSLASSDL